ncbi:hypothetical protein J3R30DRAFT_3701665 [Lentinula aciculospora]|uniref:Uncharacterized protein n=1 Tax=Lentinula aciculospora TaxID=153920 RepID=A0A9W9AEF9_9AGAR|nr:hypothetical protein J3R30DRAFT_3701665 [Lentinula aciculospora]
MATIIHRASSAIHDHPPTPLIPQRRRREPSVEIIDVDELDDSEYMFVGPMPISRNPPSQRRRTAFDSLSAEEVIVLDSDDEEYDPSVIGTSSTNSQASSSRVHSRDVSPPAPARHSVRPTGSTFPRLDSASVPMRRHPPPFPSNAAPVTANPMASDYERFLQANIIPRPASSTSHTSGSRIRHGETTTDTSRSSTNYSSTYSSGNILPPRQGPRAGQAGGGIITSARAHAAERRADRERNAQLRAAGTARPRFRNRRPAPLLGDDMHFVGLFRHDSFDPFDPNNLLGFNGLVRYSAGFRYPIIPQRKPDEPDYLVEYTHSEPAAPGFCFDFDPSPQAKEHPASITPSAPHRNPMPVSSQDNPIVLDDDGEIMQKPESKAVDVDASDISSSPVSISLVCSKCLDPLLLGEGASATALKMAADGASAEQVESERKARRVWALRCGHLIDGRCLEALGYPFGALDAQKKDVKGKGKRKSVLEEVDMADAEPELNREGARVGARQDLPPASEANPIRSRLRSATQPTPTASSTRQSSVASITRRYLPMSLEYLLGVGIGTSSTSSSTSPKTKQPRKPKIQQTHSWKCPVNKCGKVHTSVKVDGVWGPEKLKGEGAIPLFI